ncbi:MAG: hypothetical protein KDD36_03595 [Flavobacteriales bacterium]|nr:hypothetical protein [Flavobacteriales bacterium]
MNKPQQFLMFFFLITIVTNSAAQSTPPCVCCTEAHSQFDFWVGEWNVYNPQGQLVGTNRIEVVQDSCVRVEHWVSAKGTFTGTSYNFYDTETKRWRQTWVDNQGGNLLLSGEWKDGSMTLDDKEATGNEENYNRITWTPNSDGSVRQHWQKTEDGGVTWTTVFDGLYKKM